MAENNLKKYDIDSVWNGYNNSKKLINLYFDLKKEIFNDQEPVFKSTAPLVIIMDPNWRGGPYQYEIYQVDNSLVWIEFFQYSSAQGHKNVGELPPKISEKPAFDRLGITIHNSSENLEDSVQKIIDKYPRKPN